MTGFGSQDAATRAISFYRKKTSRAEPILLGVKETLQSKKQKVMAGIMKKTTIRAITKYRMIRPLIDASTMELLSYMECFAPALGKENSLNDNFRSVNSLKNRILLFKDFLKRDIFKTCLFHNRSIPLIHPKEIPIPVH